jgi:hypothetical protein
MLSGQKITERLSTGLCASLAIGVLSLAAMPAGAVDYYLAAKQFNMTMPDGTSVPMWGYVADPGGGCYNAASDAARLTCVNALPLPTAPGPRLTVAPTEPGNALQIFLSNGLPAPTSIVISGQGMPFSDAAGNGPTWNDGSVGARPSATARVRSFGREAAANGGRQQYIWNSANNNPFQTGTYAYQTGTHPQVQVQMGLYGAVSRDAAAGEAYPGVSYSTARDLFYSEVDPALHNAVAAGTYGTTGPTSTLNYQPKYFLLQSYDIGGLPFDVSIDATDRTCINGGLTSGSRILLRLYNSGLRELAPMMLGSHFDIVAEGGKRAPFAQTQYEVLLMAGSTRDLIFTPGYDGDFPLIERRLNLTDAAQMNGGMQTCLNVGGVAGNNPPSITSAPVTTATVGQAYSYDVNATDPDAGDTLTFSLDVAPAGMTIDAGTGVISWTPAAGQEGPNNVTVRATDSGTPAMFATQSFQITVAPAVSDLIFADGFESGNFSAWTAEQDGEGDLNVTGAAAQVGAFGMAALIDNNTAMWVRSDTPVAEPRYRARFYFDPNSIPMVNGDNHRILITRGVDGTANSLDITRIEFRRNNNLYQVRAVAARDPAVGGFVATGWFTINDAPNHIEIDWQAASAAGANDGSLSLWTNGVLRQTRSNLDNDTLRVESVRLGPLQGIDTGTRGTVYFDDFVSRRTTFIGP